MAAAEGPPRCGVQDCLAGTRWIDRGRDIPCRTDDAAAPDKTATSDRGSLNEGQGCLMNSPAEPDDRPESHNVSVDEQLAREGGCAQVHLASGRTCSLEHGHSASCNFVLREQV